MACAGSWLTNEIDKWSDLDLVVITRDNLNADKSKMLAYAKRFGNLLSAFTGEHVGEKRLIICLYDDPLLHVDIKFVTLDEFYDRIENPVGHYGSPRITSELRSEGIMASRPRIARLLKVNGRKSIMKRKYRATTIYNHLYAVNPNLLLRDFSTTVPSEKWVSDFTYIRTGQGWLYVTVLMDLAERKIIGWSMDNSMSASSAVVHGWKMTIKIDPWKKNLFLIVTGASNMPAMSFVDVLGDCQYCRA